MCIKQATMKQADSLHYQESFQLAANNCMWGKNMVLQPNPENYPGVTSV